MNAYRHFFSFIIFLFICGWLTAKDTRPNIIIIMCDDLGYADVGFNGAADIQTPEIDKLATAGTICTSGYVTHSFCGPSRMGLMSGRYPHTYGGQYNLPPAHLGIEEYNRLGVPENEILISKVLQDAGYYTGAIGKWHLGEDSQYHPNNRGFNEFYGFLGGGHDYFPERYSASYQRQKKAGNKHIRSYLCPLEHNGKPTVEDEYLTDELSQFAVSFIQQASDQKQPFFLYLAYNAPHSPMEAKEEDIAKYSHILNQKRRVLAGMMAAVDRGVGMVTDALKDHDLFENTLIVFLSDNGGKSILGSSNKPLRGIKGDTWEGGIRVPMFWHWPEKIPSQKYDFSVSALDLYPTFAAMAGAKIPDSKQLDGHDILNKMIQGQDVRNGEFIFSMRHRMNYTDVSARRGDWKVTRFGNWPWRLFNIKDDPGETKDLSAQYPERVVEMVKAAQQWSQGHAEPQWFHGTLPRDAWKQNNLSNFKDDFDPIIGAPELQPVQYITDIEVTNRENQNANPQMINLRDSDADLNRFLEKRRKLAEGEGRKFNRVAAERMFRNMDDDKNEVITALEEENYFNQ